MLEPLPVEPPGLRARWGVPLAADALLVYRRNRVYSEQAEVRRQQSLMQARNSQVAAPGRPSANQ